MTGFADQSQSDNIQQSTAANNTTPTSTPTPLTNSTWTVIEVVLACCSHSTQSEFTIHVEGNNPTPANFPGSFAGVDVTLGPGTFFVSETPPPNVGFFSSILAGHCFGTIAAGTTPIMCYY